MSNFILHSKTGNVHVHPHVFTKGWLSLIHVATAMLCNSSLVIIKGIFVLRLTRKQEKKVIEPLKGRDKFCKITGKGEVEVS